LQVVTIVYWIFGGLIMICKNLQYVCPETSIVLVDAGAAILQASTGGGNESPEPGDPIGDDE
jgi:hypothetical protein